MLIYSSLNMEAMKRKASPVKVKRAKKVKKASDGIKKPTSAYIYFVSDYRLMLKKKGKDTSRVQEVAKLCGAAWKGMTDEEKAPYVEKYKLDRSRYLQEKDVLDKKMGKDPNKPKRPQTAYFCFLADFRKEMAGKTLNDGDKIPQLAGERWRGMTAESKKKYELMVEKDKERYEKQMEEYKKNNPDAGKKPVPKKVVVAAPPSSDDDSDEDSEEEEDDTDSDESD